MERPQAAPGSIPGEAPPFLWVVIIAAAAIWWLLPWIERWQEARRAPPVVSSAERVAAMEKTVQAQEYVEPELEPGDTFLRPAALPFDPDEFFRETYAAGCSLLEEILAVPPQGEQFTAAVKGLHALANILDRLFHSWAEEAGDRARCQLKEESEAFVSSFTARGDAPIRRLLAHAGFRREESSRAVWCFDREDPEIRLRGLTVRLCLLRFSELQRLRGTHRWAQSSNAAVVPKPTATVPELLELYRSPSEAPELEKPSLRERNLEAEVRGKIQERRSEALAPVPPVPLALHEGLAQAARRLAQAQRVQERSQASPTRLRASEVEKLLAQMPLPPGFTAVHLYFRSTELPSIFGLTSSTGRNSGNAAGEDRAADILAREAVGHWAARVPTLTWPSASLCGVGAALDYTVNRGFVVALLIGFEGACVEEASAQRSAMQDLRRRQTAAAEAAAAKPAQPSFGARVRTFGAPAADAVLNRK